MILKLTLLLLFACVADLTLRRSTAALRHLMWVLTLVSSLLLPLGAMYAPKIAGGVFVIHTAVAGVVFSTPAQFNWVMAIYLAGLIISLLRLGFDVLSANRVVKNATPSSLPGVLISDRSTVPFVWGPIVVPVGFENRKAILAHEAAHVERGDIWTSLLARIACAAYWFHPLVWWAASRMRLEADRACDDAVLRQGFARTDYAEDLVEVARTFTPHSLVPAAITQSLLEVRLRHILSATADRRNVGSVATCASILTWVAVFSPLAAISQPSPHAYRSGPGVAAPRVLFKVDPKYTKEAIAAKITGTVLLSVTVGSNGMARDIEVKRSLNQGLDERAISAVQRWKFQPGVKDGKAVDVKAMIEVNYRLESRKGA
jgi:TonB family protein